MFVPAAELKVMVLVELIVIVNDELPAKLQPEAATLYVMVYIPAVELAKLIAPVDVFKLSPVESPDGFAMYE